MAGFDILNPKLGVGTLMPSAQDVHLPEIKEIASQKPSEVKLDELYTKNAPHQAVVNAFEPQVSTDEILRPAVFNRCLNSAIERLSTIKDSDVRAFVESDLKALDENRDLLRTYLGLMVGG